MVSNISQINSTNYDSEELNNSYHSDIYKYRMNDKNFNKSTRLRDEYFNKVENFNTNYDFNDFKTKQLDNIRQNMDISSLEYSQVLNVDKLISRLEESPKIDLSDYKISLTNSEFEKDGSIKLQLHSGSEQYVINSSNTDDLINIKEGNLKNYNYDEEKAISNKLNENQFNKDIDKDINNYKNNILNILENNVDVDFKKMEGNYEVYSNAYEKIHLENNNIDESLAEYLNNRNIIDPSTYYSDIQKEIYNNLNSQENKIMDIVEKEYGKLDPSNFDPNNRYDEFSKIENQVYNAKDLHSYAVNNFSNINNLEFNVDENNDLNLSFSNNGKEVLLNKSNNDEIIESENSKIQNLKSVELEKNVIGLLPKEQQENNYKETISRLEKNKSTLKDDLKSYMSNTKIDNAINSVKQHFENVKVKAEDIHKTFKDLGQWNTDNKLVKNIDNVIEKVKELSQKNENKIDLNDDNSLNKIEQKIKKSNEFIDNVSTQNNKENQLRDNKINFLQQTLEIKNPELLKESNSIEDSIKDLSKSEKITLYNNAKDISSLNNNKFVSEGNQLNTIIKAEKLSKAIENDIGTNEINQFRKDYLTSSTKKPAELELGNNEQLKMYSNQANDMIKNASRDDLKNYQTNANNEINSINNNQKANSLKNNELIKKFNMNNQLTNNEQQSNNMEKEHDQLEKRKKNNVQLR